LSVTIVVSVPDLSIIVHAVGSQKVMIQNHTRKLADKKILLTQNQSFLDPSIDLLIDLLKLSGYLSILKQFRTYQSKQEQAYF